MSSPQDRAIWVFGFSEVNVYLEDENGCVIDGVSGAQVSGFNIASPSIEPYLTYCYLESAKLTAQKTQSKRKVTGEATKKPVPEDYEYDFNVGALYFAKNEETDVAVVLNRGQQLRLALKTVDPHSHDDASIHELLHARARTYDLTGQQADTMQFSASFDVREHRVH